MTMDGVMLHAIVSELSCIKGAKIEKIQQPAADEIILLLHTLNGKKRLVLSANASDCRIHITEEKRDNPKTAPNFCMFLRKYIGGGRIEDVRQNGLERVVYLDITASDEMGVIVTYTLVCEIMSKHSNMMLLSSDGHIMESLKHVSFDVSRVRQVLPGMTYVCPPSDKFNPFSASAAELAERLVGGELPACIGDTVEGISHQTATDIAIKKYGVSMPEKLSFAEAADLAVSIKRYLKEVFEAPDPCVQKNQGALPVFYSIVPYAEYSEVGRERFKSANEAVDGFYTLRRSMAAVNAKRTHLLTALKKNRTRVAKKLQIQLTTLSSADNLEKYRVFGELITANIYAIKRGMKQVTLTNYYTGEPVLIPLDEKLSPSGNAAKYFKKVGKLKNALTIAKTQSEEYAAELEYLDDLEYTANAATSVAELEEVRLDMVKYGYIAAEKQEKIRRDDPLGSPFKFVSSDGLTILAGRNGRSNDALTMHIAGKDDYWFHGRNIPGSHVILFTKGAVPPDRAIFEAATIAATLSKAKNSGKTDIDYTPRSHVWKANGAKPGMVLYDGHTTITVRPDQALLDKLREI